MIKDIIKKLNWGLWMSISMLVLSSCSAEEDMPNNVVSGDNDYAEVWAEDHSSSTETRAAAGMTLSQFSLTVFNAKGKTITSGNLIYKDANEAWNNTTNWKMATTGNMKAFAVSPTQDIVSNVSILNDAQTFEYTNPISNQTMIKIGSDLSFTRQSTNNKLTLMFFNALSTLSMRSKNNLKLKMSDSDAKLSVKVYVKGVVIHNLKAHGKFTFNTKKNSNGSWALYDDVYYNYAQDLENPVLIDSIQYTAFLDSTIIVLPQTPDGWAPSGTEDAPASDAISVADAAHKTYVELKCSMIATINNVEQYVWGNETTFPSIYLPYVKKQATVKFANMNTNGMYTVLLQEGHVLDAEGHPIKPQTTGGNDSFLDAEFVSFSTSDSSGNDWTDDWGAPEETIIEF